MSAVTAATQHGHMLARQMRERRVADQLGRLGLMLVLVLVAAIYLVAPFFALTWMQVPFIGAFLEYPITANVSVTRPFFAEEELTGTAFSLRQNDNVVGIDGRPISSAAEFYAALRGYQPGDVVTLDVVNDSGSRREVGVVLSELPLSVGLGLFGTAYIVGLVYIGIGLWVYRARRDQVIGRTFLMLCISMAILLGTTFDLWTTHIFTPLWSASVPWVGAILVTFALVFPSETTLIASRPAARLYPVIPALLLMALVQLQLGRSHVELALWWRVQYIFAGTCILIFIGAMLARAIFAASPAVREQSRVVLAGTAVAFLPFILALVFNVADIQIGWVLLATILFPLTIAYSIVQYSVLDTGRVLSFTATYSIMALVVMVGFALLVAGVNTIIASVFLGEANAASPALIGLVAFVLVLVFQPARAWLQERIDRLFFRSRAEYQERLTTFRHDLTLASGLGEVVRLLKQQIRETVVPTHAYVFLRDNQNNFLAVGEGSRPDTDIRFEAASGLVHALNTSRDLIFLELSKPLPPELVEEHAKLAVLRTPILAPLKGQDRLAGFVAIGNRRSGENYAIQDLRFIQALTEQASLAVERAQVLGDMERRVRELDVLSQVSQAVNFTTEQESLLDLIYTQLGKLIDTTNFYAVLKDEDRQALYHGYYVEGDDRLEDREHRPFPPTLGLESEVIRTGRPIRTPDYEEECEQRGVQPLNRQFRGWMGVPLNAGTRTLGTLAVSSFVQGNLFTEDQLKVFWAIADQAATALDKAHLFSETETRARQLATLNEISKELSSTLDLETLLTRIMASAVDILNGEAGTLYLAENEELVFRVVWGGAQELVGTRMPITKGIAGQAATSGQPAISNNVLQDKRWFSDVDRETAFQTQALLAVPLLIHDQTIGVVQIINKKDGTPFDEDDASLLTTFAAQAAVAIENARLYEATDAELADRVDELQNLQRIDRELNRTLDFNRVVQITIDWAQRLTGASATALAMLDAEGTGVNLLAANGYSPEFMEKYKEEPIPLDVGIVGRVLRSGKPEFVRDLSEDPDYVPSTATRSSSLIAVPILRANKAIGVLVLEADIPELFDEKDYEFAQRLVEHAAVAIENARLVGEVTAANRSKTEFISFVSHELKNPMTSIRGYTDLLKSGATGAVTDMQVQFLGTIRSNVDRMTRLVSDLSDVARIETGHLRLDMGPIPVQGVVDETLRGMSGMIQEKEQKLDVQVPEELPLIYADHTRMVQVLTNLVSNAHKYTPEGGTVTVGAKVEIMPDEQNGGQRPMVHHWVADTGIGMSPEDLQKLFTKFFRTARGKDMAPGTGLGLNITKNLVEVHGGTIWVESEEGKGTTFHYTIPAFTEEMEQQAREAVGE